MGLNLSAADHWLETLAEWWLRYDGEFWYAILIYSVFFMIFEMIIHELGHYYFQKKFGVRVRFFKIGIFNLYSKIESDGTRFIIGIPILKAESQGVGELADREEEKHNPDAFYYIHRHPVQRLLIAVGGSGAVLLACGIIFLSYFIQFHFFGFTIPTCLYFCFGFVVFNQLFNLLCPIRFSKAYATDGWIAIQSLWHMMKKPRV